MATSVTQAIEAPAAPETVTDAHAHMPVVATENAQAGDAYVRRGTNSNDFVTHNRIHVEHGSLFIDPYLVVHPRELAPEHEQQLRDKLQLTYSINNPSFYESADRAAIAMNLGQLVPVSLTAKRSKLMDDVQAFNTQVDTGADAQLQQDAQDKRAPFAAIARDTIENPDVDPVGMELLKNGLSIYLLMREKLTQNHYLNRLTDYVVRSSTPDQVLHDLADKIGVSPQQIREAALEGGIDGVGKLLGLDPRYVADVKDLTNHAAEQDFGYNLVEHWHLGRQLLGIDATLQDKITTGLDARITAKISEYRGRVRHHYDVPEPIQQEEQRIATEDMSVLEPIQRQLLFAQDYEISYTPENTADGIAFHKGVYGLHRRAANDLTDFNATNRIFYSGHGSRKAATGTLAHEVAHNFWPNYFDKKQTAQIDHLAASDAERFANLSKLMGEQFEPFERLLNAYKAGNAQEKAAVIAAANEEFAAYHVTVNALFPHLTDAKSFRFMVWDANDVLQVEGARYNRSGYDTPQERFREVISRYAEMRQVSHRDEPGVLKFLAPGLTEIWEELYIPHLERVYQDLTKYKASARHAPATTPLPVAANDEAPAVETLPKVEERPTAPNVTPMAVAANDTQPKVEEHRAGTQVGPAANAHASAHPNSTVQASSIQHNQRTLAAMDALHDMGINARF